jgi:hypothetical protein
MRLRAIYKRPVGWRRLLLLLALGVVAVWCLSRVEPPQLELQAVSNSMRSKRERTWYRQSAVAATRQALAVSTPPVRLLLATHNRLVWYTPSDKTIEVIHEGQVRIECCALLRPLAIVAMSTRALALLPGGRRIANASGQLSSSNDIVFTRKL